MSAQEDQQPAGGNPWRSNRAEDDLPENPSARDRNLSKLQFASHLRAAHSTEATLPWPTHPPTGDSSGPVAARAYDRQKTAVAGHAEELESLKGLATEEADPLSASASNRGSASITAYNNAVSANNTAIEGYKWSDEEGEHQSSGLRDLEQTSGQAEGDYNAYETFHHQPTPMYRRGT
jgi:hypothetical protein